MSATMTPPATVPVPTDTATQPAPQRVVALPPRPRTEPAAPTSRATRSSRSTTQLGDALFFTAWASALTVVSLVGAVALAVATPIVIGRAVYDERKYR